MTKRDSHISRERRNVETVKTLIKRSCEVVKARSERVILVLNKVIGKRVKNPISDGINQSEQFNFIGRELFILNLVELSWNVGSLCQVKTVRCVTRKLSPAF